MIFRFKPFTKDWQMVVFAVVVAAVVVEFGGFLLNGLGWPSPVYTIVEAVALVGSVWAVDAYRRRRLAA
ncbi:MAG: hypothetical protein ABJB93_11585 [Gaiellales bacterium]